MSRVMPALILLLSSPLWAAGLDVPKLAARVTDLAGVLSQEEASSLEAKLRDLETSDSTQVAVLILPGLEGEVLEEFSERVATAWRLGQQGRDNGALLLVAMKERKIRIEVGYGLEGKLTDALSRRIIQNEIVPNLRAGNFYQGIDAGVTAIALTVRGQYQGTSRPRSEGRAGARRFDWIVVLLFPLLWILSATGMLGGMLIGCGAGLLMAYSFFGGGAVAIVAGGILGGAIGAFAGRVIRAGARSPSRHRWGGGGPFIFPGGGGFGSGGFGGGFGGGGFSGGGGRFGGGGSSGSW